MLATPWLAKLWRTRLRKAVVSWNCSWATSCGWSFFTVLGLILQTGELIAQGDKLFGQRLEGPVIIDIFLDLGGLVRRNALGELLSVKEPLKDIIGATGNGRTGSARLEKLRAQGAAAEAVDGLHLQENGLPFLVKIIQSRFHGYNVSIEIQPATTK
jgi:hypothetical protein